VPQIVVSANQLDVRYGAQEALNGVHFQVERGNFVAILGPNGSGKTTLIKALLGVIPVSSGALEVFGSGPGRIDPARIGYVPQVKTMERTFPALAVELVVSGARRRWPARVHADEKDRAIEVLDSVGAAHLAERPLNTLSGGELQRVFLARSLIRRPELVMLDEPAAGIDVAGASDLYELLEQYQNQHSATVLMVTHDWHVAHHHATHVLLINRLQVGYGTPDHVLTEPNLRQAFGHVGHAHTMSYSVGGAEKGG
jgi:zinc transport system ATP-binding protein